MVILLAGFGPFGEVKDNPSGRVVHRLKEELLRQNPAWEIHSVVLPVHFGTLEAIELDRYQIFLGLGVDVSATHVRVEVGATNHFIEKATGEERILDAAEPKGRFVPSGALPGRLEAIAGVTVGVPGACGSFVCNETFYRALKKIAASYFIHLPNAPSSEDGKLVETLAEIGATILRSFPSMI